MGLGSSGSTSASLSAHHGASNYLLNGHEKEFKGLHAFDRFKSCPTSPYSKGAETHSEDEDERVDIMDEDDQSMTPVSSLNGLGNGTGHNGTGHSNDFQHKLFGLDSAKQTSAESKDKSGEYVVSRVG